MASSPLVERALQLKSPRLAFLFQNCSSFSQLKAIHAHTLRSGLFSDPFCASRLLAFSADAGELAHAGKIFSQVARPNLFMHNALIRACAGPDPARSVRLFCRLLRRSLSPDNLTFPFLLKACSKLGRPRLGGQAHSQLLRRGFSADPFAQSSLLSMYSNSSADLAASLRLFREIPRPDAVILTSMLTAYCDHGDVAAARKLFDEMPSRTPPTFSSLISGYVKNRRFREALELFYLMQGERVTANEAAVVGVLAACAGLGALSEGRRAHEYISRHGIFINCVLGTALVDMYAKCGDVAGALSVFEQLPEKDWLSYTMMIAGLASHGRAREALDLFADMVRSGLAPRAVTFTAVLSACSHAGLVDEGLRLFESMVKDHGIERGREHYGCMVDLLGRAGRVGEAERLAAGMPMGADGSVWGAVLGACSINRDGQARVGELVGQVGDAHGGHTVLVSNILAGDERWDVAAEVRDAMHRLGINKEPGQSSLETQEDDEA